MKTLAEVKTPAKSHRVSFKLPSVSEQESMAQSDPLPIVELKPFVQKVWRREKSFVTSSDKGSTITEKSERSDSNTSHTSGINGSRVREFDITSDLGSEECRLPPPPRTAQSLPSHMQAPRLMNVYVNQFEDFKTQKEHINRLVGESELRRKTRLHPVADTKNKKQVEHSVSIIPGFITRDDRTKTTLNEISEGEMPCKAYNCSPKDVKPEEFQKHQEIRIAGEPLIHSPQMIFECTPTPVKGFHNTWHSHGVIRHESPASMLTARVRKGRCLSRAKTPLYDCLDRMGTLPSLIINATTLKKRGTSLDDMDSEDYSDYRDVYPPDLMHRVGGIQNSLLQLSKEGPPTKVERQLTFELERNLSRFRKSKDYSPFEINPSDIAKYCPTPTLKLTQGEEFIRQALQSNSSKRTQSHKSARNKANGFSGLSQHQTYGMLRKTFPEIDHIDSYDTSCPQDGYHPTKQLFDNKDMADDFEVVSPDEELTVPYDTPRSQMDSRISIKHTDDAMRVQSESVQTKRRNEEIASDITYSKNNDTKSKSGNAYTNSVPSREQNQNRQRHRKRDHAKSDNGRESIERDTPRSRVSFKESKVLPSLRPTTDSEIGARGRTFLTSDNVLQITAVHG